MTESRLRDIDTCAKRLGRLTKTIPNMAGGVLNIWDELIECYGLRETLLIIEAAYRDRDLVVTNAYPKFYVQHVKFYSIRYWTGEEQSA
jgi:hypothetical protein